MRFWYNPLKFKVTLDLDNDYNILRLKDTSYFLNVEIVLGIIKLDYCDYLWYNPLKFQVTLNLDNGYSIRQLKDTFMLAQYSDCPRHHKNGLLRLILVQPFVIPGHVKPRERLRHSPWYICRANGRRVRVHHGCSQRWWQEYRS